MLRLDLRLFSGPHNPAFVWEWSEWYGSCLIMPTTPNPINHRTTIGSQIRNNKTTTTTNTRDSPLSVSNRIINHFVLNGFVYTVITIAHRHQSVTTGFAGVQFRAWWLSNDTRIDTVRWNRWTCMLVTLAPSGYNDPDQSHYIHYSG